MSTRSQLRFVQRSEITDEQSEHERIAQIYRHSNGYPDSVLSGLFGVVLVILAAGVVALLGGTLVETPLLVVQVTLLGLAGVVDVVAATESQLTARWAWYQWSGLGNILLGLALPLGFAGTDFGRFFVVVTGVGGLSLAAMGVDLVAFHGQYTRGQRLSKNGT